MITRDDDDGRARKRCTQSRELPERIRNRSVRWSNAVKNVACNEDDVGLLLDDTIQRGTKRQGDIAFAEVDAACCDAVVGSEAQVQVGEVSYAQGNLLPAALNGR